MERLIAHRGLKEHAKENTLEAFSLALKSEHYAGFECDIRTTKDGVFVVCHNPMIGLDIISNTSYKKLKRKYHLPTLEQVLKLDSNKIFLLEIKEVNIDQKKFQTMIQKFSSKKIYVMSFFNKVIQELSRTKKREKYGVLNYIFNSEESYQEYDFICLLECIISKKMELFFAEKHIETFIYGIHHFQKTRGEYPNSYFITDEIVQ